MKVVSIVDILNGIISINTKVNIYGWIRTRRHSKTKISFINVYDGSCFNSLQVIANHDLKNYTNEILKLTSGCSVKISGILTKSIGSKQKIELVATHVKILGWVDNPSTYPITAKKHTMEYLRTVAHLRPRTHVVGSITRIRNTVFQSIHNFMNQQGFIWIPTPILTQSDTEGNSKMFYVSDISDNVNTIYDTKNNTNSKMHFFGKTSFLTVSGQLNAETYACALSKVYSFGPTFRAEHSNTSRHLAEFWMLEPEIAFANLSDIITLAKLLLKETVKTVLEKNSEDIKYLSQYTRHNSILKLENFINSKFICIEYTDAINLLISNKKKFNNPIYWGIDLFSEHEKYLLEELFKSPIIIINHPKNIKAFYMRLNKDNKTVSSMDILIPEIGEMIGGSQREERLSILDKKLEENNLSQQNYWWYRDLRRYGTVPHSGFGLGFERLISYITGIQNIRDVVPFPRTFKNIDF